MPDIIIVPEQPGYDQTFRSRDSDVGRDLSRRATRVQLGAKASVGVKTGLLKRDITKTWVDTTGDIMTIRVGSNVRHALMHHEGTRPHMIHPTRAKALRFVNKRGEIVFARAVQHPGTKPNHYLTDNLHLAQ
jgi:hypothetical protein